MVQLSHPYMTTGKTIALTRWAFVSKITSLLFIMLSSFVIAFLPNSKCLLISWLQSPSAVTLEPKSSTVCNSAKQLEQSFFNITNQILSPLFLNPSCGFLPQ